jgi:methionine sulfoxide reductase heme-binding subunit
MAHGYSAIQWNRFKLAYDLWLAVIIIVFLGAFLLAGQVWAPPGQSFHPVQAVMRAFGACAFFLLTLTLAIGPLARMTRAATPLLYNRRHLGVATFLIAAVHAGLTLLWYFGFAKLNPALGLLINRPWTLTASGLPFELFGLGALIILLLLAATSHDYWQKVMSPLTWKRLHMAVYPAYGLIVVHVAFGALLAQPAGVDTLLVMAGAGVVATLHLASALLEALRERRARRSPVEGWLVVGPGRAIADGRAVIVSAPGGERIAVFREGDAVHAVSNVCPHQNGPIGEGRIIDGCITCPWHGWQYRPADGLSPPPFDERIDTYRMRLEGEIVFVDPVPLPAGVVPQAVHLPPETAR